MITITSDRKARYAVTFFTLAALLSAFVVPSAYVRWTAAAVLSLAALLTYIFVKKRSIHSYNKRQVLLLMIVISTLFLMLYYLTGIYFGIGAMYQRFTLNLLVNNIIPITIVIFTTEFVRSVLLGQDNAVVSVSAYLSCVFAELLIAGGVRDISSSYALMDFIGMTLFPAITANLLYNYTARRYGMSPIIAYRLILTLYVYIIPFIPNAPQILPAFALMILPLIVYMFIDALFEKRKRMATRKKSNLRFIFPSIILVLITSFAMLVSCQFRFGILVIASPSMTGEINKGDAVVFESYERCDEIKENDIIVFSKDGKKNFVHRVIEINTIDGQKQYITKGDANEDPDAGFVTDGQIVGVVRFKVLYIGYPSLWLREIFD